MDNATRGRPLECLRITWAIAAKDIADALRNRATISLMAVVALVMLMGRSLPFLLNLAPEPRLIIYDAGRSQLAEALRQSPRVRMSRAASQEELEAMLVDAGARALGLAIPAGLDEAQAAKEPLELDGYYAWGERASAAALASDAGGLLAELAGRPVRIDIEGHVVYPRAEAPGALSMVSLSLLVILMMAGGFLVPCLIFEEKEARTMDSLLVSPASIGQVVAGKALAGATYCLTAAAVALAFNRAVVVHWGIAILATLAGALLAVSVGLLLGSLFENPQQMSLWAAFPVLVLLLPPLVANMRLPLPAGLGALLPWVPTVALDRLYGLSFCGSVPLGLVAGNLGIVLAWAAPALAGVVWVVRRSDR